MIRINSTGHAILICDEGLEIIVKKGDTGLAHDRDRVQARLVEFRRGFFYAAVASVTSRSKESYAARLVRKTKNHYYFELIDQPGFEVCADKGGPEIDEGDTAFVSLDGGTANNRPHCAVLKRFSVQDESYDFQRISLKHGLPGPHGEYPELEGVGEGSPSPVEYPIPRKDYRALLTVTIDGEDAKDFDDAVSLERTPKGWLLHVHIADVSSYVAKGTQLDREALERGTSYYIGRDVIPMLPEILSNDLCSLRQGRDRLTLSAELSLDFSGNLTGSAFHPGVIRVRHRLTYTGAEKMLSSGDGDPAVVSMLKDMQHLAMILKNKRMKKGRLDLNLPEEKILYDGERVSAITFAQRLMSHMIIEEFMLSANEAVSRALTQKGIPTLYRVHESISDESMTSLRDFLRHLGIKLPEGDSGEALQEILARVAGKEYEQVVNLVILKSLMQAYYGPEPLGHFGLAFKDYTHFTSPIRRYPDLVVHRCLKSLLAGSPPPYSVGELERIGETSSDTERVAQKAERDMVRLKSCRLLIDRVGEVFSGVVSGITGFGFFVALVETPIEGLVPMRNLTDDYYIVKEDEFTIVGRRLGRRFRLGDSIEVRLEKVDIELMRIDFDLA
ncbi:MAG TPA: ribonuclease R [Spirochaetota bacterium]|nr:ribonuclease R [Spirochaetota bacterium]